jgi:hypothetical protein
VCCVVHVQMELMAAVAVPDEEEIAPLHLPNTVAVVDGQYRAPPSVVVPGVPDAELKDWDAVVNSSQGLNDENKNGEPEGSITTAPDQGPTLEGSRTGPGDDGSARATKPDDAARVRSVSLVAHQLPSCRMRTQIEFSSCTVTPLLSHTCPQVIQRVALRKLISDDTGVCVCE